MAGALERDERVRARERRRFAAGRRHSPHPANAAASSLFPLSPLHRPHGPRLANPPACGRARGQARLFFEKKVGVRQHGLRSGGGAARSMGCRARFFFRCCGGAVRSAAAQTFYRRRRQRRTRTRPLCALAFSPRSTQVRTVVCQARPSQGGRAHALARGVLAASFLGRRDRNRARPHAWREGEGVVPSRPRQSPQCGCPAPRDRHGAARLVLGECGRRNLPVPCVCWVERAHALFFCSAALCPRALCSQTLASPHRRRPA